MKVVINECFGGFELSPEALLKLYERGAIEATPVEKYFSSSIGDISPYGLQGALDSWRQFQQTGEHGFFLTVFTPDETGVLSENFRYDRRNDPELVRVVEEMGTAANDRFAKLKVVEIPDDVEYIIEEYDGLEHIAEKHRTWS